MYVGLSFFSADMFHLPASRDSKTPPKERQEQYPCRTVFPVVSQTIATTLKTHTPLIKGVEVHPLN